MDLSLLNTRFEYEKPIDIYESLIWTDRYSRFGDFEIYTPANQEVMNLYKDGWYLESDESEHLMIIESRKIQTDVEFGNYLVIVGRSLESILDRRIIWTQTILNGSLQNGIEKLLNENAINPSISARRIPNLIFEKSNDPFITGLTIESQFTGDNLYDAIVYICETNNIGFKITLNKKNQFVFQLYAGTDRSYDQSENSYVVFSPNFDNIINSNYIESKTTLKTVALVAGEGEGSLRKTTVVGNSSGSGLSRRELFVDARDISSTTEAGTLTDSQYKAQLTQRGKERLSEWKETKTFDGQTETTQMYRFGEHFSMGDIVQLEDEYGNESTARITEYIRSESDSGIEAYPTFNIIEKDEVA